MKKIFSALLLFASTFMFTSCFMLFSFLSNQDPPEYPTKPKDEYGELITTTIKNIPRYRDVYLLRQNLSDNAVDAEYIGFVPASDCNSGKRTIEINQNFPADSSWQNDNDVPLQINKQFNTFMNNAIINNRSAAPEPIKVEVEDEEITAGDRKYFYYCYNDKSEMKLELAECMATGKYCNIWFIDNSSLISDNSFTGDSSFKTLASKFDKIYSLETQVCGSNKYETICDEGFINPKTKINIVVTDIFKDAEEGQASGTFGYFSQSDCYTEEAIEAAMDYYDKNGVSYNPKTLYTNETQVIYLDSYFYLNYPQTIYSTLVHEFNHLLNFCQKSIVNGLTVESWYTEMLSMTLEDMFQSFLELDYDASPKSRIAYFDLAYYYGFKDLWTKDIPVMGETNDGKKVDLSTYVCYANTYVFGAYLARNYGGIELIKEIAQNDKANEESITKALEKFSKTNPVYYYNSDGVETLVTSFKEAVENEYHIFENYSKDESKEFTNAISLQKTVYAEDMALDLLEFSPAYIAVKIRDSNEYYIPDTEKAPTSSNLRYIGSYGFLINYVGYDVTSFDYSYYSKSPLSVGYLTYYGG